MSRGLGKRQRAILEAIDALGGRASVLELSRHIEGRLVGVGESAYEATRRAAQALVGRGLIRLFMEGGKAVRWSVRYTDGTQAGHIKFGRPQAVEASERRLSVG